MENRSIYRELNYIDLGTIGYKDAWDLQKDLFQARSEKSMNDMLLLLEHDHTYTLGKTADRKNLLFTEEQLEKHKISLYDIDRGGDITYHGPGQLVGYPIIKLNDWKADTHLYLRTLEEVLIQVCGSLGLNAGRSEGLTGVWIEERKIAAIGIKVSRWITMHGFAFNINTDLDYFQGIIPCGIQNKAVTSLEKELGESIDIGSIKIKIIEKFKELFEYNASVPVNAESINRIKENATERY